MYLLWDNFCRRYCEWWSSDTRDYCQDIDAIVLIVDTRFRLPTEILLKGMQQEQGPW